MMMVGVRTPIREAALRFIETALIAMPVLVRFMKMVSPSISATQMAKIIRFCTVMTMFPTSSAWSGKMLSLRRTSEPQMLRTISCTTYCIPIVAIIRAIAGRLYSGR